MIVKINHYPCTTGFVIADERVPPIEDDAPMFRARTDIARAALTRDQRKWENVPHVVDDFVVEFVKRKVSQDGTVTETWSIGS